MYVYRCVKLSLSSASCDSFTEPTDLTESKSTFSVKNRINFIEKYKRAKSPSPPPPIQPPSQGHS